MKGIVRKVSSALFASMRAGGFCQICHLLGGGQGESKLLAALPSPLRQNHASRTCFQFA